MSTKHMESLFKVKVQSNFLHSIFKLRFFAKVTDIAIYSYKSDKDDVPLIRA